MILIKLYAGWLLLLWGFFFAWIARSVWIRRLQKKENIETKKVGLLWDFSFILPKSGMWIIFYELGRFLNPNFFNQCSTVS